MRALKERAGSMADRLLTKLVPSARAQATECSYTCCGGYKIWRYDCVYPDGHIKRGTCVYSSSAWQCY